MAMYSSPLSMNRRNWVAALHGFLAPDRAIEHCELCGRMIAADHGHLIEPRQRTLGFVWPVGSHERGAIGNGGLLRVPTEVRRLGDFHMSDEQWNTLLIPIGLAFFFHSQAAGRVLALYPGPAGATESLPGLDAWQALAQANPGLASLAPDVEALLIHRIGPARQYYRVPIDRCYALVGLIRKHWHGLSGGSAVYTAVARFFADLDQAADVGGARHRERLHA